jgi:selenocysteine lyase/cysteine desulfurase
MRFSRQIARLEEDELVHVTRIPTEPFDSFEARFVDEASTDRYDLVFVSQVFFDSGFALGDLQSIAEAPPDPETLVVFDGYHGFMAVPTDLSAIADRAFYLAGGYKYAMAGEGTCFLHCPTGYGARPRDTGWYAGFGSLESSGDDVPFADDGSRFLGATFDVSGLYRFNAVQDWLASESLSVAGMLAHVREIEHAFLNELDQHSAPIARTMLLVPDDSRRGRFLAFRTPNAGAIAEKLGKQNIIVDSRGDRLRIGFGIYHETGDAVRVAQALAQ